MKDQCNVTNKSAGFVIYNIPELGVRREFAPHEAKHIKVDELDSLSMMGGGKELIYNYLFINDDEIGINSLYFNAQKLFLDLNNLKINHSFLKFLI